MIAKLIDGQSTLWSLCAASSYTYRDAFKMLYRHPTCRGAKKELAFLAALFYKPHLGPLVRSYTMCSFLQSQRDCDDATVRALLDRQTSLSAAEKFYLQSSLCRRALILMVNLDTLSYSIEDVEVMDHLLRCPFTFRLKELRWSSTPWCQEKLHRFLKKHESIKCLSLFDGSLCTTIPLQPSKSLISLIGTQRDIALALPYSPGITHLMWHPDIDACDDMPYPTNPLHLPSQSITHLHYSDEKPLSLFADSLLEIKYLCLPRSWHTFVRSPSYDQ